MRWGRDFWAKCHNDVTCAPPPHSPLQVEMLLNKKRVMEVDTGVSWSAMRLNKLQELGTFRRLEGKLHKVKALYRRGDETMLGHRV